MRFRGMYPESFLVRLIISPKIHFKAGSWVSDDVQTFSYGTAAKQSGRRWDGMQIRRDYMLANCGGDKEEHQTKWNTQGRI